MRLNKKTKSRFVGPASCLGLVGILLAGMICPQLSSTFAAELDPEPVLDKCASIFAGAQVSEIYTQDGMSAMSIGMEGREGVDATADEVRQCLNVNESTPVSFNLARVENESDPIVDEEGVAVTYSVVNMAASEPFTKTGSLKVQFIVYGPDLSSISRTATILVQFKVEEFLELVQIKKDGATDNAATIMYGDPLCADTVEAEDHICRSTKFEMGKTDADWTKNAGDDFSTAAASNEFMVGGNNADGFGVYVSAPTTSLVHEDSNVSSTIATISAAQLSDSEKQEGVLFSSDKFGVNTWGYNLQQTNGFAAPTASTLKYKPVSSSMAQADLTSGGNASTGIKFFVTTGVKINDSLAPGTYTGTMNISAVAPPLATSGM